MSNATTAPTAAQILDILNDYLTTHNHRVVGTVAAAERIAALIAAAQPAQLVISVPNQNMSAEDAITHALETGHKVRGVKLAIDTGSDARCEDCERVHNAIQPQPAQLAEALKQRNEFLSAIVQFLHADTNDADAAAFKRMKEIESKYKAAPGN